MLFRSAASAARILPGDRKRIVRALEVWLVTGHTLTAQFAGTRSPVAGYDVLTFGLRISPALTAARVAARVEALAHAHPRGDAMPIQIFSRENLWPLPWYLRRFSGVQWWNGVPETGANAPLILVTPDMEEALARRLYELPPPGQRELYVNIFDREIDLRPQVEVRGYAAKALWDDAREFIR